MQSGLTLDAVRRIAIDVKDIMKSPLTDQDIYYEHNQDNIRYGYAMIIGQRKTPYFACPMLFRFEFPNNYPYSPPKLNFCSSFQSCRLHPNFYKSGKCCLSILNTWNGEKWTSCLTIRSILITISSLLTERPLQYEPGKKKDSEESILYERIVQYATMGILRDYGSPYTDFHDFKPFKQLYNVYLKKHCDEILEDIKDDGTIHNCVSSLPSTGSIVSLPGVYGMNNQHHIIPTWPVLREKIVELLMKIKTEN